MACYNPSMSLREYQDPTIVDELGTQLGAYVTSYSFGDGVVEVHVFRNQTELVAFLTKSPGFPMAVAHDLASQALVLAAHGASTPARIVLDADSLDRSGSV